MLLSHCRKLVDSYFPSAGRAFRLLRDASIDREPKETIYGFKLAGDSRMASADWEAEEARIFLTLLDEHDVVVDIGANVGFYSCLAALRRKRVVAFEPSRRNLKFLFHNLWLNQCSDTEVFPMGLGSHTGLTEMFGFGGTASFIEGWGQSDQRSAELVPVTTLDTVLGDRFAGERLLIKMDVEGTELDVLHGASMTLHREPKPTWLVEVMRGNDLIPGGTNQRFADTFEYFWSRGYECRTLDGKFDLITPSHIVARMNSGRSEPRLLISGNLAPQLFRRYV